MLLCSPPLPSLSTSFHLSIDITRGSQRKIFWTRDFSSLSKTGETCSHGLTLWPCTAERGKGGKMLSLPLRSCSFFFTFSLGDWRGSTQERERTCAQARHYVGYDWIVWLNCHGQSTAIKGCLHIDVARKCDPLRRLAILVEPFIINKRTAVSIL